MIEVWKPIKGYESRYLISNQGRVLSLLNSHLEKHEKPRLRKISTHKNGYPYLTLRKNISRKTFKIHRLVAEHFLEKIDPTFEVAHLDGNTQNNVVTNLKWCSRKENESHKILHGTYKYGVNNPMVKLSEKQVFKIRELHKNKISGKEIAKTFGISQPHASDIINRRYWKHI